MSIRESMRESVAEYLRPGEEIGALIGGQTMSPYSQAISGPTGPLGIIGSLLLMALSRYRIIVVSSQRILVLDAGMVSMRKARKIITELPRSTQLGPASGSWHVVRVNGKKLWIPRQFFKDIEAADAAANSTRSGQGIAGRAQT